MQYIVEGDKFVLSYKELKSHYLNFCSMSNETFVDNILAATHLACTICYLKEIPTYICLSDKGIVHELLHLTHLKDRNTTTLSEIRELFKEALKLS